MKFPRVPIPSLVLAAGIALTAGCATTSRELRPEAAPPLRVSVETVEAAPSFAGHEATGSVEAVRVRAHRGYARLRALLPGEL